MHQHRAVKPEQILLISIVVIYLMALYLAYIRGLTSTLEGESALTAKAFLKLGDWSVNHMNGLPDYDKPSFFYWLIALASLPFGQVTGFAVRIPSLVASAAIMLMFRLYNNAQTADSPLSLPVTAAFVFISCPKVFWMTQIGRMDMVLNMLCFATLTMFVLYLNEKISSKKAMFYWLFFTASALSVLTKGPVGILITWPPVFMFLAMEKNWRELRHFFLGPGILLFLLIALPWYIHACVSTNLEFFRHFFLEESVSRFGNIWKGIEFKHFNRSSPGIYVIYFLTGFFPWSLILPLAITLFVKQWDHKPWGKWFHMDNTHKILLFYIAWIFFFFSVCGVKRSDYILPMYPAAALLTADFLVRIQNCTDTVWHRIFQKFAATLSILLSVTVGLLGLGALLFCLSPVKNLASTMMPAPLAMHLQWFSQETIPVLTTVITACITAIWAIYWFKHHRQPERYALLLSGMITASWIFAAGTALAFIDHCKSMEPWCRKVVTAVGPAPLYSYHFWDEECAYYIDRPAIPRIGAEKLKELLHMKEKRIYIMIREKEMKKFKKKGVSFPWVMKSDRSCWRTLYIISNMPDSTPQNQRPNSPPSSTRTRTPTR